MHPAERAPQCATHGGVAPLEPLVGGVHEGRIEEDGDERKRHVGHEQEEDLDGVEILDVGAAF